VPIFRLNTENCDLSLFNLHEKLDYSQVLTIGHVYFIDTGTIESLRLRQYTSAYLAGCNIRVEFNVKVGLSLPIVVSLLSQL